MHWSGPAIVCATLPHGEAGAIVRLLTPDAGLLAGYVRGGGGRRTRPALIPGNRISARWHARVESQLGHVTLELDQSAGPLMLGSRLSTAVLAWSTALTAHALPERHPYPALYDALAGLLTVMGATEDPRAWCAALVRYELILMSELGFGLDLSCCVATGATDDLAFVSPKSSQAVSRAAGLPWADRMLPLPGFLAQAGTHIAPWPEIADGLRLTGHFIERDILHGRVAESLEARQRLLRWIEAETR